MKENKNVGRPSLGITKKISLTLTKKEWELLDQLKEQSGSKSTSELFRTMFRNVI